MVSPGSEVGARISQQSPVPFNLPHPAFYSEIQNAAGKQDLTTLNKRRMIRTPNLRSAGHYEKAGAMTIVKFAAAAVITVAGVYAYASLAAGATELPPPLKPETTDVATLAPGIAHRFIAIPYEGSMQVLNGDRGTEEGEVPAGTGSNVVFSPGGDRIYIAETMWTHNNRGTRIDLLTVYDTKTLTAVKEIALPGRTLVAWKLKDLELNASGSRAYIYNMHPSSSVTWVDLGKGELGGTIEVPGCGLVFAWGDSGFSSLCADGSLATVVVSEAGAPKITHSKPFFDAENDPIFDTSVSDSKSGTAVFLSYSGLVYQTKLGSEPSIASPWSINEAAGQRRAGTGGDELAWRPGGLQPMAWHKASNRLYVLMHPGNYWTHNVAGTEVWALNLTTHALVARYPVHAKFSSATPDGTMRGIAVSQDDKPQLAFSSWPGSTAVARASEGLGNRVDRAVGRRCVDLHLSASTRQGRVEDRRLLLALAETQRIEFYRHETMRTPE
jgi:methylamine dehydrogenase heavy chain